MAERTLEQVAFPQLEDADIALIAKFAKCKKFKDGETLFEVGERDMKFYVVKSGEVEILDYSGEQPHTVTIHRAGHFTGDVSHLTGRPAIVSAVCRGACEVYEVCDQSLRRIIQDNTKLGDLILQSFMARRKLLEASPDFIGLRIIGSRYSRDTFRIRDFLARNRVPTTWTDLESDPLVEEMLKRFGIRPEETPVVACGSMLILRNPSNRELADELGIRHTPDQRLYDLLIVGGGPAGLAAAVYGASEGLSTIILEREAPGGQAGTSMRIENYLGFPTGITGSDLINKAVLQANKFGAVISAAAPAGRLKFDGPNPCVELDGNSVTARCLLIATGAEYRRLPAEGREKFEGAGCYYAATPVEAPLCRGQQVMVVGGGNSAGQAAVFLATLSSKVLVLLRGDDLYKNMSSYLAKRIEQTPNIEVMKNCEITHMLGDERLQEVQIKCNKTGEARAIKTVAVFSFIGAVPRTEWLNGQIECDPKGFVKTGYSLTKSSSWTLKRPPLMLETSHPGIFAAGDVRYSSVKRVASAVGEGSMAVQFVHRYLSEA